MLFLSFTLSANITDSSPSSNRSINRLRSFQVKLYFVTRNGADRKDNFHMPTRNATSAFTANIRTEAFSSACTDTRLHASPHTAGAVTLPHVTVTRHVSLWSGCWPAGGSSVDSRRAPLALRGAAGEPLK